MALKRPLVVSGGSFQELATGDTLVTGHVESLVIGIHGGGVVISTGSKSVFSMPYAAKVVGWKIVADVSGSIVVDFKTSTYAGFPTTASIAGTEKPTLSAAQKNEDTTITTWSDFAAGDMVEINVDSASTVTRVFITLSLQRL